MPGKIDLPDLGRSGLISIHDATRSLCAVALGSDGSRAWFLIVEGLGARLPLDGETSGRLMFLAGECAGVLLHRDLPAGGRARARPRFAGWPVLRDIEGREDEEATSRRIGSRFLVARLLRATVDDDFAIDPKAMAEQVTAVARELTGVPPDDPEQLLWDAVLRGLDRGDWRVLSAATRALARSVELQGHHHGARELYEIAHHAAVAGGSLVEAAECARMLGRLFRWRGEWDEAIRWYEAARAAVRLEADSATEAVVLDGLASAVRDKGNLPRARELLQEGLLIAQESGDDYALASIHHTFMSVERLSGRLAHAVAHGWRAVNLHPEEEKRHFVLVSLAGCLAEMGELNTAEDSYAIVAERVQRTDWRCAALVMLAHISALRGDRPMFEERLERHSRAGWRESASTPVHAQTLQYLGLSWLALGETGPARTWLERARDYAQEHGVNQVYFECESALAGLDSTGATPAVASVGAEAAEVAPGDPLPADLAEIRGEIGALRRELAPV